jgi:hypothetical protein
MKENMQTNAVCNWLFSEHETEDCRNNHTLEINLSNMKKKCWNPIHIEFGSTNQPLQKERKRKRKSYNKYVISP